MKTRVLLLSTVFFVLPCTLLAAQDSERFERVADAAAVNGKFMGTVLVAKEGNILFEKCYGLANAEWKVPNTPDTKFRIGSLTKQFTSACVLLLEERGKLNLFDPISRFLPNIPAHWEKITIQQLLSHTSGIPNFNDQPESGKWKRLSSTPEEIYNHVRDIPLRFIPGERMEYSNTGYILLGAIIERASGRRYAEFLSENILGPLGLHETGYDDSATVLPQRASGYEPSAGGIKNADFVDMHVPFAAGALYSTTHDLFRWHEGLFAGKVLSSASLDKMTTPVKNNYALGLTVSSYNGHRVIEHGGEIDGFTSDLATLPSERITVVVLSNLNSRAIFALTAKLIGFALAESVACRTSETKTLGQTRPVASAPPAEIHAAHRCPASHPDPQSP